MSVCLSVSVADVIRDKYNLSAAVKEKYRFLDIDTFLEKKTFKILQFDPPADPRETIPAQAKPYAAVSYVWRDLVELPSEVDKPNSGRFNTFDLSPNNHPTSVDVLIAICTAAKQLGCKNLWMDGLCLRQDNADDGKADRAWQIQHMYGIYQQCEVCLVAAGGMVRLPRMTDRTSWLTRAWTLQEALAPAKDSIYCLFTWNSGDKTVGSHIMQHVPKQVLPGIAMLPLEVMLSASKASDVPKRIDESKGYENDNVILPDDPDSQVYYFGYGGDDNRLIEALQGALDRPHLRELSGVSPEDLSGYHVGIWRCITMRYASYSEDFVFATMGIFGVNVEALRDPATGKLLAKYPAEKVTELLSNFLGVLAAHGTRADWFAVAPELGPALETGALPLVPGVNFDKGSGGGIDKPVKSLLRYWDRFSWHLSEALEYTVVSPSRISVTAPICAAVPAGTVADASSESSVIVRAHDEVQFRLVNGAEVERFGAVVLGHKSRYQSAMFPPLFGDRDGTLLMIVEMVGSQCKNTGYAWVPKGTADGWAKKAMIIV